MHLDTTAWQQVGSVSLQKKCLEAGGVGGVQLLSAFVDWIHSVTVEHYYIFNFAGLSG